MNLINEVLLMVNEEIVLLLVLRFKITKTNGDNE